VARILQVCNSAFYLSHFLVPLVRGLVAAGHQVECVCEGSDFDLDHLGRSVRVRPFPFQRSASPADFLLAIQRMRAVLREGRYDCVDSHNRSASIVGRVAAWLEHVPVNLYTAHGFYFHDDQGKVAYAATIGLEAFLARITDYTLSQSAADAALMTRRRWIDPARIEVIGNGIDTRRFSPRKTEDRSSLERSLGLQAERFRIAATGRLVRGKGFTDLLEAFARFHERCADAELLIIGGIVSYDIEPYQAEFLAQARSLGVADAVKVSGMVDCVESYLATSDVFVLPSYREGMPRALLEAMSMELPVIATDIRGCREIVRPGIDGWLFEPHDVTRLTALLTKVREDPDGRAAFGRHARERVCQSFDERDYVARQVEVIDRLLDRSTRRGTRGNVGASVEAAP
jgi:glycosyltransferase involved in cell wall biosynthesis